jgi:hypothetical protein
MLFPSFGARMSVAEIRYPDLKWKEICAQMAHLINDSGMKKGKLTTFTHVFTPHRAT